MGALADSVELDQLVADVLAPAPATLRAVDAAGDAKSEVSAGEDTAGERQRRALRLLFHQDLLAGAGLRLKLAAQAETSADPIALRDGALLRLIADTCDSDTDLCLSYVSALSQVRSLAGPRVSLTRSSRSWRTPCSTTRPHPRQRLHRKVCAVIAQQSEIE